MLLSEGLFQKTKAMMVCCLFSFRPLCCSRSPERRFGCWCCGEVQCGNRSSVETCPSILRYDFKRYNRKKNWGTPCYSVTYILSCSVLLVIFLNSDQTRSGTFGGYGQTVLAVLELNQICLPLLPKYWDSF